MNPFLYRRRRGFEVASLTFAVNLLTSTLAPTGVNPFWQTPVEQGNPSAPVRQSHERRLPNLLTTTLAPSADAPFVPVRWPNPSQALRASVSIDTRPTAADVDINRASGGANPLITLRASAPRFDARNLLLTTLGTPSQAPFVPQDWARPRRARVAPITGAQGGRQLGAIDEGPVGAALTPRRLAGQAWTIVPTISSTPATAQATDAPIAGGANPLIDRVREGKGFVQSSPIGLLSAPNPQPQNAQYHWPVVRRVRRGEGSVSAPSLSILTTPVQAPQNRQSLWATPQPQARAQLFVVPNTMPGLSVPDVFFVIGWGTPDPLRRPSQGFVSGSPFGLLTAPNPKPNGQAVSVDRLNRLRSTRPADPPNLLSSTMAPAPPVLPFDLTEWPNPGLKRRPVDVGQQTERPQFYQDAAIVGAFTAPDRLDLRRSLRIEFVPNLLTSTMAPAVDVPFVPVGFDNPAQVRRIVLGLQGERPAYYVEPIPVGQFSQSTAVRVLGKADWIQPLSLALTVPAEAPLRPLEWLVPAPVRRQVATGLQGARPTFYRDAPCVGVASYDLPLPRLLRIYEGHIFQRTDPDALLTAVTADYVIQVRGWPSVIRVRPLLRIRV